MSTAITIKDQVAGVEKLLDARMQQIAKALPEGTMTAHHFARTVLTLCARNPELLKCNPGSLLGSVMQAAQLGLTPDPVLGEAWFVPFKGVVQFIPGYKGLIKLAWQSDRVAKVSARVVREGDSFSLEYGLSESLVHIPRSPPDAPLTHAYAVVHTKDSPLPMFVCLSLAEIKAVQARSPSARSGHSPWKTDFEAMAMKSALRRVCKLVPSSTTDQRLQRATVLDEQAEHGLKQHLSDLIGEDTERDAAMDEMEVPQTTGEEDAK